MLQLGRKMSLLIVALPFSCSWLLTVFAQRVEMIYSTSFIGGFFSAITLLATQVSMKLNIKKAPERAKEKLQLIKDLTIGTNHPDKRI